MASLSNVDFQIAALATLMGKGEVSGRDLAKQIERDHNCSVSYGQLYVQMGKLADSGVVTVRDGEDEDGRVRYFSAVPRKGQDKLRELEASKERLGPEGSGELSPA